jgi:hypothetical protein
MKLGTKSLLFGVHQVIWHPIVVLRAWIYLYGWPTWRELICIIVHDWGYWGKPNLDGREGLYHPLLGATIAWKLFGEKYGKLCLGHSRSYAKHNGVKLSKLCWADKYAFVFDPYWFYIIRAKLSGELKEIRQWCTEQGYVDISVSNREWYNKTVEFAKNMPEIQHILLKKKDGKVKAIDYGIIKRCDNCYYYYEWTSPCDRCKNCSNWTSKY